MDTCKIFEILKIENGKTKKIKDYIVKEFYLHILVNNKKKLSLVCTPKNIKELVVGYLFAEGIIQKKSDIKSFVSEKNKVFLVTNKSSCIEKNELDIVRQFSTEKIKQKLINAACDKDQSFVNSLSLDLEQNHSQLGLEPAVLFQLINELYQRSELFKKTGGVHNSLLTDIDQSFIIFREDISRHNTVDKIIGYLLLNDIRIQNKILVISGRISADILLKTAKMKLPILVSPSAPTDMAVKFASQLGITLIGFVRGERFNVYSHSWRLKSIKK